MGVNVPGGLFDGNMIDDDSGAILSDWKAIINEGDLILDAAQDSEASSPISIYTVPAGKKFYLAAANLNHFTSAASKLTAYLRVAPGGAGAVAILYSQLNGNPAYAGYNYSCPLPTPFVAGTTFSIVLSGGGAANNYAHASIQGYEI